VNIVERFTKAESRLPARPCATGLRFRFPGHGLRAA